jgi:hypothetical protein
LLRAVDDIEKRERRGIAVLSSKQQSDITPKHVMATKKVTGNHDLSKRRRTTSALPNGEGCRKREKSVTFILTASTNFCEGRIFDKGLRRVNRRQRVCEERTVDNGFVESHSSIMLFRHCFVDYGFAKGQDRQPLYSSMKVS